MTHSGNESNNTTNKSGEVRNASSSEMYFSQYLNGAEGPSSSSGQKDSVMVENGGGFSGSKDGSYLSDSGESLRAILSDPITYEFSNSHVCVFIFVNFLATLNQSLQFVYNLFTL